VDGVFHDRLAYALGLSCAQPLAISPFSPGTWEWMMVATLFVCMTCKAGEPLEEGQAAPGALLHAGLSAEDMPEGVRLRGVECLSACTNGCSIALSAPGCWTYVYGRLSAADIPDILSGAAAYAASPDGIVPWRARPVIFRKQSLARIPPLEATHV
jgi:predicted metal-binding protein